jgi:hypothetical protein
MEDGALYGCLVGTDDGWLVGTGDFNSVTEVSIGATVRPDAVADTEARPGAP